MNFIAQGLYRELHIYIRYERSLNDVEKALYLLYVIKANIPKNATWLLLYFI